MRTLQIIFRINKEGIFIALFACEFSFHKPSRIVNDKRVACLALKGQESLSFKSMEVKGANALCEGAPSTRVGALVGIALTLIDRLSGSERGRGPVGVSSAQHWVGFFVPSRDAAATCALGACTFVICQAARVLYFAFRFARTTEC